MQAERYFGTYARFDTLSKKDAAILLGADNPIGDVFEIVFQTDNGVSTAWMKNRFGALIGFLDAELSRRTRVEITSLVVVRRVHRPSRTRPLLGPSRHHLLRFQSRSSFQAFHSYNDAASFRWRATGNRSRRARCRTGNLQQWKLDSKTDRSISSKGSGNGDHEEST